jgi:hypothetical protein
MSFTANIKEGTVQTRGVFVQETDAGTAGKVVAIVPPIVDVNIPLNPVMQPYSGNFNVDAFLFDPDDLPGDDDWPVSPESYQIVEEPKDPNAHKPMPRPGYGLYKLYFSSSGTVDTAFNTALGETYQINVVGHAVIEDVPVSIQMLNGNGQGDSIPSSEALGGAIGDPLATGAGVYNGGSDLYTDTVSSVGGRCSNIEIDLSTYAAKNAILDTVDVEWRGDRVIPASTVGDKNCGVTIRNASGDTLLSGPSFLGGAYNNQQQVKNESTLGNIPANFIPTKILVHGSMDRALPNGSVRITQFDIGLRNYDLRKGDAFYRDYNVGDATLYAGTDGFLINGAKPASIPAYEGNHLYFFEVSGTGSPLTFSFVDSDYSDNEPRELLIYIKGSGAK